MFIHINIKKNFEAIKLKQTKRHVLKRNSGFLLAQNILRPVTHNNKDYYL